MNFFDVLDQVPGEVAWKDKDGFYLGCNTSRANKIQLKHPEDIIGLSDRDLSDQSSESIAFHRRHDQLALQGDVIKTIHPSAIKNDGIYYFQLKKALMLNGEIAGVIYHCSEFSGSDMFYRLNQRDNNHFSSSFQTAYYEVEPRQNFYHLTERELECLFCMLRGLSANEAGKVMLLSKRTIEFYIDNIKNKMGCQSKPEVMIKAIEKNYIQVVPKRFLNKDIMNFLIG
jgi:DNA-binding CsgD family transcriptional regulator